MGVAFQIFLLFLCIAVFGGMSAKGFPYNLPLCAFAGALTGLAIGMVLS